MCKIPLRTTVLNIPQGGSQTPIHVGHPHHAYTDCKYIWFSRTRVFNSTPPHTDIEDLHSTYQVHIPQENPEFYLLQQSKEHISETG